MKKILSIAACILVISAFQVQANEKAVKLEAFDDRYTYDVYFNSGEGFTTIAEGVEIDGFKEINGEIFLLIRSKAFKLQPADGFILFSSITAILPTSNFRVKNLNKSKLGY